MEQLLGNDGLLWPGSNSGGGEEGPRGSWTWRQRPARGQLGAQGLTGGILSRGGMQSDLPLDLDGRVTPERTLRRLAFLGVQSLSQYPTAPSFLQST